MDAANSPPVLVFGRFTVDRHRREIVADGQSIELAARAFDTLLALIDALELHARGETESAAALLARWNALDAVRSELSVVALVLLLAALRR